MSQGNHTRLTDQMDVLLRRTSAAVDECLRQQGAVRQRFDAVRPRLEALAAAGDQEAAALLAETEEALTAELRFVPSAEGEGHMTLAWVLPARDEDTPAEIDADAGRGQP